MRMHPQIPELERTWPHQDQLPEQVRQLIRDGHADNTRRAYQSDIRAFCAWGANIPTDPITLARYIAEEGARLHPSTLQRRLAALSTAHQLVLGSGTPTNHPLVKAAMRGLRRSRGVAASQASPLLVEDLWTILDRTGDSIRDRRDRALLLLGFAGGLRRSELVGLDVADLDAVREGLIVVLRRSKTDQDGCGRRIGIPHARGRWCPVRCVNEWLAVAEISSGPLFRSLRKGGGIGAQRLSTEAVSRLIKRHVHRNGLDPSSFSGHSLRAGFITSAARAGISGHLIRRQTGHASDETMSRYIREGNLFTENAAARLL